MSRSSKKRRQNKTAAVGVEGVQEHVLRYISIPRTNDTYPPKIRTSFVAKHSVTPGSIGINSIVVIPLTASSKKKIGRAVNLLVPSRSFILLLNPRMSFSHPSSSSLTTSRTTASASPPSAGTTSATASTTGTSVGLLSCLVLWLGSVVDKEGVEG